MIASNGEKKFIGHIVLDVPAKNPTESARRVRYAAESIRYADHPEAPYLPNQVLRGPFRVADYSCAGRPAVLAFGRSWGPAKWQSASHSALR